MVASREDCLRCRSNNADPDRSITVKIRTVGAVLSLSAVCLAALAQPARGLPVLHPQVSPVHVSPAQVTTRLDIASLQRDLDGAVRAGVPGVVYLIRTGGSTTILTSGSADLASGRAMTAQDRARIGSITKTFVATLVLQLVGQRRLALDAPVAQWLPDLLPGGRTITVRQLLQHTSGLYDYTEDVDWNRFYQTEPLRRWTPEQLIHDFSLNHPQVFAPGAGWGYSNTGYLVLGLLVEKVTGQPLERLLAERLLRPLGLHDTYLPSRPAIRGRFAHGYTDTGTGQRDVSRIDPSYAWAAGAMVSTASDIATFYRALLAGRVLPKRLLDEMTRFQDLGDGFGYGLGLMQTTYPGCSVLRGHTGGGLGFATDAEQTLDGRRQVVVLVNTDTIPEAAYPWFQKMADLSYC